MLGISAIAIVVPTITACGEKQVEPDNPNVVKSITLDKTEIELTISKTEQLTATVLPENAIDGSVFRASDNEEVATVDEEGFVEAIAPGKTTITATTEDGNRTANVKLLLTYQHL